MLCSCKLYKGSYQGEHATTKLSIVAMYNKGAPGYIRHLHHAFRSCMFPGSYHPQKIDASHIIVMQGNLRVRRYSHLQLHVAVPAYSQVAHSVRVMQLQLPALADFCKYRSNRYSQFTRSHTCSLLATQAQKVPSAILSYIA